MSKNNVGRPKTRGVTNPLNLRISKELSEKIELYSSFSGYTKTKICETLIEKGLNALIDKQSDEIKKWKSEKKHKTDIFNNFNFKL